MKIRFIICPNIPENIKEKCFHKNCIMKNKSHDWRSIASEKYAFEYIGIKYCNNYCQTKNTIRFVTRNFQPRIVLFVLSSTDNSGYIPLLYKLIT